MGRDAETGDPKPENTMEDLMLNVLFDVPLPVPITGETDDSLRAARAEAKRARKAAARRAVL